MRIFLSWSQPRSRHVASLLHEWLPSIIQALKPWMSDKDIDAGRRWGPEISDQLEGCNFGIASVTPEALRSQWLLFESGALAKKVKEGRLVPLLLGGMSPTGLSGSPLASFQAKEPTRADMWKLIVDINDALAEGALSPALLAKAFDKNWSDFEEGYKKMPAALEAPPEKPSTDKILGEILTGMSEVLSRLDRIETRPAFEPLTRNELVMSLLKHPPVLTMNFDEIAERAFEKMIEERLIAEKKAKE